MEKHNNQFREPTKKVKLIDADRTEEKVKISDKPAWMVVRDMPTIDAVEVVRCEDCTHYNGHRYCRYTELIVLDNDFCSYGERKDNERKAD